MSGGSIARIGINPVMIEMGLTLLSVCPELIFFCIFIFYVLTVLLLKDMGESFLLSKDEPLTPNIDGVVTR